jgi:hypothetical protein
LKRFAGGWRSAPKGGGDLRRDNRFGSGSQGAATRTIPIVFEMRADPVVLGLVTSLSRPGGNLTDVVGLGAWDH